MLNSTFRLLCYSATVTLLAGTATHGQQVRTHPVTGRQIAPVMGAGGADWLDRSEREREEQPDKALRALNLRPGMFVGDVGAGTGFYTLRIAQQIAPTGRVFANDIQPAMLTRLRRNAAARSITNFETVLGTEADPRLPSGALDLVLMVDVYHELSDPQRMLQNIRSSLKPDGKLVLLEFRKEDPRVPIRPEHEMSVAEAKSEICPEGYEFERVLDTLPWQHILFFRKAREGRGSLGVQ